MSYDFIILQKRASLLHVQMCELGQFVTVSATNLLFIRFLSCPGGALCEKATLNVRALSYSDNIRYHTGRATKRAAGAGFNKWSAAARQQRHTSPSFVSRLTLSLKNNTWTDVREEFWLYGRAALARKTINDLMPENKDRVLFCALASRRHACQLQQVIDGLFNSVRSIGKFYLLYQ
jgi:hypothetical protein